MQPGTEHLTQEQLRQLAAAEVLLADADIEWSAQHVHTLLSEGAIELVDVREAYERDAGHIPKSRHIELERLAWNAPTIEASRPVVFYCRLGLRAKLAAHAFRRIGFTAYNLTGGFATWHAAGLPVAPEGGFVAEH
jgi:rhodanese-related sulfurtransferase